MTDSTRKNKNNNEAQSSHPSERPMTSGSRCGNKHSAGVSKTDFARNKSESIAGDITKTIIIPANDLANRPRVQAADETDTQSKALVISSLFKDEYEIKSHLGRGRYGDVWLAEDLNLGIMRAVKTLRFDGTALDSHEYLQALRREARILAKLEHPNIVGVHAWRSVGDQHFLFLQFVDGSSIEKLAGNLHWSQAVRYVADVADGLIQVHQQDVIHRDIKPANILYDRSRDEALLTDFGIADHLAGDGIIAGSRAYMAPEATHGKATAQSDVYSLAATLFQLITGELPFRNVCIPADLRNPLRLAKDDTRFRKMPEGVETIIRGGLEPSLKTRPELLEFLGSLHHVLNSVLVDTMSDEGFEASGSADVALKIYVSRVQPDRIEQLIASQPKTRGILRDMTAVPQQAPIVSVSTGDLVRIEAEIDRPGYVSVFNIGPSGNFSQLCLDIPTNTERHVRIRILDARMTPPSGKEKLITIWTRSPLRLQQASTEGSDADNTSDQYRSTRSLLQLLTMTADRDRTEWRAEALGICHT